MVKIKELDFLNPRDTVQIGVKYDWGRNLDKRTPTHYLSCQDFPRQPRINWQKNCHGHRRKQQDDSVSANSTVTRANTRQVLKNDAEKETEKESSENKWFQSFNQSSNKSISSGTSSSSSSLEQAFNQHFDINEIKNKELTELLQDSMMTENEP